MKLFYYCKSCKKKNYYKTKTSDRFELQKEVGNEINERCKYCGIFEKKHINRLHAEPNKFLIISVFIIAIILSIAFWNMGIIAKLTIMLPFWVSFNEQKKASDYNKIMVSRK